MTLNLTLIWPRIIQHVDIQLAQDKFTMMVSFSCEDCPTLNVHSEFKMSLLFSLKVRETLSEVKLVCLLWFSG